MRFFRKTLFWVIALAVIGGAFYFINRQVEEKKVVEEIKKRLFPFESGDIAEFQIIRGSESIFLRKEGGDWFLESPLRVLADKEAVQKLLEAVKFNQKVWSFFQAELTDPENPLPQNIRENILNLSLFIDKRLFEVMANPEPEKLSIVIDINYNIAEGLRTIPA